MQHAMRVEGVTRSHADEEEDGDSSSGAKRALECRDLGRSSYFPAQRLARVPQSGEATAA